MDIQELNQLIPSDLCKGINCTARFVVLNTQYSTYYIIVIGNIEIARFFYDGGTSKTEPRKYKVTSEIGEIRREIGRFETQKEAAEKCVYVVNHYVKLLTTQP